MKSKLQPYLSPLAVWALSVGSAIGWGSLVVTSKTYLSQAGPVGSVLGLLIGFGMMLMVANHYHFLGNRYPSTGGLYNYIKFIFGYDRAFLVAWYMFLVYIAIFWANATSIPLFARYFLRGVFSFGYLYTIFGHEVYLGEALVTIAAIAFVALLCIKSKKATARSMVAMVLIFTIGITICFAVKEGVIETHIVDGDVGAFGIIVCDVNGLKKINDTLGHKAGDEYICSACKMLCEYFKHSPVFRIGGDEFVVLLEGQDFDARQDILRDINTEIEGNISKNKVVISLGLAEYDPAVDKSFHEVFMRADGLMYDRKIQLKSMGAVTRD